MSLLHIGHTVGGGWFEGALLLTFTFIVIWLHLALWQLFKAASPPRVARRPRRRGRAPY